MSLDTNECLTDNGGCDQNCNNTDGTYSCWCDVGYALELDEQTCSRMYNHITVN